MIVDALAFLGFLALSEKEGFANVIFNPSTRATRGTAAPVADLRAKAIALFD